MSSVVISGDTSGAITLQAPSVSGNTTLTLPTTTGTVVVANGAQTIEFADGSASAPSITNSGDTNTGMFFPAADTIAFADGGVESMRIDSSGNVLVGTTDAGTTSGIGLKNVISATAPVFSVVGSASTGANSGFTLYSTGAGAYRFYVTYAGQINATSTSIIAISDQSLKENIKDLETGLTEVMALKPRRFDWKEEANINEKNVAGFIAQEVQEVMPDLVYDYQYNADETKKALKMGDMLPTLVKAIQELKAIVDEQAEKIKALEAK